MYKILYYQNERGDHPVDEFLLKLDLKTRAKVIRHVNYLAEHGPHLVRPYADIVRGKIRELRIKFSHNNVRILYFFFIEQEIILLHVFLKKSQGLNTWDIEMAERRMMSWINR